MSFPVYETSGGRYRVRTEPDGSATVDGQRMSPVEFRRWIDECGREVGWSWTVNESGEAVVFPPLQRRGERG